MSTTIKFCPKCHREAYRLVEEGEQVKVIQWGKTLLNISETSNVTMNINCPAGHPVKLVIGGENVSANAPSV